MLRVVLLGAALVVLVLALPVVAIAGAVGGGAVPTAAAVADIPARLLALYQDAVAQRCPTLPWSVVAAIGKVESDHGRIQGGHLLPDGRVVPPIIGIPLDGTNGTRRIPDTDGGLFDEDLVYDRAVGPMQFIPTTWARVGVDASGDGRADPNNAADAVHAAAVYLCNAGASDPSRVRNAVWAYNNSWEYVEKVLARAALYAQGSAGMQPADPTLIAAVLANPRLSIYQAGRHDIAAGIIDVRVLTLLQLISQRHTVHVSSLKSGHSRCVGGGDRDDCRVSHHWHGRGVDIRRVDGQPVRASNDAARELAVWLAYLDEPLRPSEVGTPWGGALLRLAGYFTDAAHSDHLHIGYQHVS